MLIPAIIHFTFPTNDIKALIRFTCLHYGVAVRNVIAFMSKLIRFPSLVIRFVFFGYFFIAFFPFTIIYIKIIFGLPSIPCLSYPSALNLPFFDPHGKEPHPSKVISEHFLKKPCLLPFSTPQPHTPPTNTAGTKSLS